MPGGRGEHPEGDLAPPAHVYAALEVFLEPGRPVKQIRVVQTSDNTKARANLMRTIQRVLLVTLQKYNLITQRACCRVEKWTQEEKIGYQVRLFQSDLSGCLANTHSAAPLSLKPK